MSVSIGCGIDFGTSNCLAAVADGDDVQLCPLDPANTETHVLPSLLYFSRYEWQVVGRAASHAYQKDPDGQFIRALKSALPEADAHDQFRIMRRLYSLPDLLRFFFVRIREQVEAAVGEPVTRATIGRPVRFSQDAGVDSRAQSMLQEAAESAGFTEIRFLSEPEAATRYYFHSETGTLPERATVLVFDFGGGTLDLCLARTEPDSYRVLHTSGAHIGGTLLDRTLFESKLLKHLGHGLKWGRGLDLPRALYNRLINPDENWRISESEYRQEVRKVLDMSTAQGSGHPEFRTLHRVVAERMGPDLFAAIEAAKLELSVSETTEIRFERNGIKIQEPLSRDELREIIADPLARIRALVLETLAAAGLKPEQIDRVVLAGGSSSLVSAQELLHELFGPERVPLRQDLFTSIASGLALAGAAG